MAVLLQYNAGTVWTVQQLHDATQIKMDFLIQVVQILSKAKLLTAPIEEDTELNAMSSVELFTGYKKYVISYLFDNLIFILF